MRYGADAANPGDNGRHVGVVTALQHRFEKPGRLNDLQPAIADPTVLTVDHQMGVSLDAGQIVEFDFHAGFSLMLKVRY